jgi:hypothetical protein
MNLIYINSAPKKQILPKIWPVPFRLSFYIVKKESIPEFKGSISVPSGGDTGAKRVDIGAPWG